MKIVVFDHKSSSALALYCPTCSEREFNIRID